VNYSLPFAACMQFVNRSFQSVCGRLQSIVLVAGRSFSFSDCSLQVAVCGLRVSVCGFSAADSGS
jgi:hypothetical protein